MTSYHSKHLDVEDYFPLRGPLPPSDLPVSQPITPVNSLMMIENIMFQLPSWNPRRDSIKKSTPLQLESYG